MNPSVLSPARPSALLRVAVDYPSSDGKPMAENDLQRDAIMYGIGALEVRYIERKDVYVSGDLLLYYEEGNPRASVAPDVLVVFGAQDRKRMSYKLWEEPKGPDFVLEVASPGTWKEDVGPKRALYARLGVEEYWQYDPTGAHLSPVLQGRRLRGGRYERLAAVESADGRLTLHSEVLGLDVWAKSETLRFRDPVMGRDLPSHREVHAARRAAEARAEREAAARRESDARAEREAAVRRESDARAEREAAARRESDARAEREAAARRESDARAEAAQARMAELEALLRARRG